MFCTKCGAPLEPDNQFCPYCGQIAKIGADTQENQSQTPAPAAQTNNEPYYAQSRPRTPARAKLLIGVISTIIVVAVVIAGIYFFRASDDTSHDASTEAQARRIDNDEQTTLSHATSNSHTVSPGLPDKETAAAAESGNFVPPSANPGNTTYAVASNADDTADNFWELYNYFVDRALLRYLKAEFIAHEETKTIRVIIRDSLFFKFGEAELWEGANLDWIIDLLAEIDPMYSALSVEGYTDTEPVLYQSAWYLTSIRAVNLVNYIMLHSRLDSSRLTALGFGEENPIAPNDTPENMARNRRIEFVFYVGENNGALRRPGGNTTKQDYVSGISRDVEAQIKILASVITFTFNRWFDDQALKTTNLAYRCSELSDFTEEQLRQFLASEIDGGTLDAYISFPDNTAIFGSGFTVEDEYPHWKATEREWYINAVNDVEKVHISLSYFDIETDSVVVTFAKAVLANDGSVIGVICLDRPILEERNIILELTIFPYDSYAILTDAEGNVAWSPRYPPNNNGEFQSVLTIESGLYAGLQAMKDGDSFKIECEDGVIRYFYLSVIEPGGWRLYVAVPEK